MVPPRFSTWGTNHFSASNTAGGYTTPIFRGVSWNASSPACCAFLPTSCLPTNSPAFTATDTWSA